MAFFIDLFSPETHDAFRRSSQDVSGFRLRHRGMAERVKPGDTFVCYLTRVSRWCGVLDVVDGPFLDKTPIFVPEDDPFVVRFHVRSRVWLDIDKAVPIHDDLIWKGLSFTKDLEKNSIGWTGKVRGSLVRLDDSDGRFLAECLVRQASQQKPYPLDEKDQKRLARHTVSRPEGVVTVSVPEDAVLGSADAEEHFPEAEVRESVKIQALLAEIGAQMGMTIWIPRGDRERVLRECNTAADRIVARLPLNYDETTLRTIEQIDVLWLRRRSIIRAFEVEHTTLVYSGILRMADLLALQPNMDIRLHIVAPSAKREKVFQEIQRPVFSLLEKGPLAKSCTYLSYESVRELSSQKLLAHLADSVVDEYAEEAE